MDVGATLCKPRAPRCDACPAQPWCAFAAESTPTTRARSVRAGTAAFKTTSRWLRGRILDALRDTPSGTWATIDAPIGDHDAGAVQAALAALGAEGLAELHPRQRRRARLPIA
jgi:A/G-specific adenine glycosylase